MLFSRKQSPDSRYKPRMAKSVYASLSELKVGKEAEVEVKTKHETPLFTVASVELGNTTTKCILTTTNLKRGRVYLLNKTVKLTKSIRHPKIGEETFGKTVWGKPLSREAVKEFIREILSESLEKAGIDKDADLHFVVRSTGVTAGFAKPEETGNMIKALAEGCLAAGINPSKMVAPLSKQYLPDHFKPYSNLDKASFTGAIAGLKPPRIAGEIMANEMEADLSTSGIKLGAKWADVEFRNPVFSLDFGTTFKGRITDDKIPYAQTIGSVCGLSGALCDAMIQGTDRAFFALELYDKIKELKVDWKTAESLAEEAHKFIRVEKVPITATKYGTVPVNSEAAKRGNVILIGCDVGSNGSNFPNLRKLGAEIYQTHGLEQLYAVLDYISALIFFRVTELAIKEGILNSKVSIGITGRAGISGMKPHLILNYVDQIGLYGKENPQKRVVFVEDGLALGANVMARCMCGLGTPRDPLGGNREMGCILRYRMNLQGSKNG